MEDIPAQQDVDEFILRWIDSVPHLEALLLLWNARPREWSVTDMARALYVHTDMASGILEDLAQHGLISPVSSQTGRYVYGPQSDEQNKLMQALDRTYRHELVRISTMIHSKAPSALRDFARAFRFTKDKDKDKE
jgi:DNA-binding MarR family transcriptional regulator